ncbi:hypothetical protein GCM10010992_27560 [Cloacibacterium rupense]|uniref:Uncharacterized protein n=1 Tax=Cloacibacterium rupense TaxID=517423 RepID=A0ABQ2NNN4_9FLAO|nr:hypothetical protein [Cloacibacterium rupense]GGP06680.1 hypothetical protein GCM10010992_27560 [Cloacibacterium rupense]
MRKKTFILLLSTFSSIVFSQVAIGKLEITKLSDNLTPNPDISLEFGTDTIEKRGIVLPWVTGTTNTSPFISGYTGADTVVDGTIVYDISDYKVKYKKAGTWFDLSVDTNGNANTTLQDSKPELPTAKAAIGTNGDTDTTPGILVLTDSDKAMVLPKVALPHLNIKNPTAGMLVYDTVNRQLAVFNGTNWSFWKP